MMLRTLPWYRRLWERCWPWSRWQRERDMRDHIKWLMEHPDETVDYR